MNPPNHAAAETLFEGRRRFVQILFALAFVALFCRAFFLQVIHVDYLQSQAASDARISVPATRGRILDRNGEVLAVSTPLQIAQVEPGKFVADAGTVAKLAEILDLPPKTIRARAESNKKAVYLKRQLTPYQVMEIKSLGVPGISFIEESHRYYPNGEVLAHLLGFTNIEDKGQVGLERSFNDRLNGQQGRKRFVRNGEREVIEKVEDIALGAPGEDLVLTIDKRLQYIAYRELKEAVNQHKAKAGSVVILDAKNGDILAMANQPSFNPNRKGNRHQQFYKNRAVSDVYEPGSTVKPFAVYCALEAKKISPNSVIDTNPGYYKMGGHLIRDHRNFGELDVAGVLQKSSNVGAIKMAMTVTPENFWGCYNRFGFGQTTSSGVPGEASGHLADYRNWHGVQQASMAFGYGMSTNTLQLARAYLPLANDGMMPSVSILQNQQKAPAKQVMDAEIAGNVRKMLEKVITREGTGYQAAVENYRVAGKTGTSQLYIEEEGGYGEDRYVSLFSGIAPATDPRWVMVVSISDPNNGEYYGGAVAAPVFSKVMTELLRLTGVAPDQWYVPEPYIRVARGPLQ